MLRFRAARPGGVRCAGRPAQRLGTPLRVIAHAAIRLVPGTRRRLSRLPWLWQPGWQRACYAHTHWGPDPYGFPAREYEAAKRDLVIEVLDQVRARPEWVLEVGCGDGLLTARLADHARRVVAVDISHAAAARARQVLAGRPEIAVECRALPLDMPGGRFDLIVCCDVLHYWTPRTLRFGLGRFVDRLRPGGRLLLVHDRADFGQAGSADAVHDAARACALADDDLVHELSQTLRHTGPGGAGLRVDVLRRAHAARLVTDGAGLPRQLRGTAAVARLWTAGTGSAEEG